MFALLTSDIVYAIYVCLFLEYFTQMVLSLTTIGRDTLIITLVPMVAG
jgi:hypothetical protein